MWGKKGGVNMACSGKPPVKGGKKEGFPPKKKGKKGAK
jgi:hypothetical protein